MKKIRRRFVVWQQRYSNYSVFGFLHLWYFRRKKKCFHCIFPPQKNSLVSYKILHIFNTVYRSQQWMQQYCLWSVIIIIDTLFDYLASQCLYVSRHTAVTYSHGFQFSYLSDYHRSALLTSSWTIGCCCNMYSTEQNSVIFKKLGHVSV